MVNVMLGVFYHNKNIGRNTGVGKSRFTVVSIQNTGFFKNLFIFREREKERERSIDVRLPCIIFHTNNCKLTFAHACMGVFVFRCVCL